MTTYSACGRFASGLCTGCGWVCGSAQLGGCAAFRITCCSCTRWTGRRSPTGSRSPCAPRVVSDDPGDAQLLGQSAAGFRGPALADRLFGGSRSKTAGELKSDECLEWPFAMRAGFVVAADLHQKASMADVRRAWTGTHGLGWVTW